MIVMKQWEFVKQLTVVGVFNVGFQFQNPLGSDGFKHQKQQGQQFHIMGFFVFWPLHGGLDPRHDLFQYGFRVGRDKRPNGRPNDNHNLKRLPQNGQMAPHGDVPAQGASDNDDKPNNDFHGNSESC